MSKSTKPAPEAQQPVAIFGELAVLSNLATALGVGMQAHDKWIGLQPKEPLLVRVLDSEPGAGGPIIKLEVINLGLHAMYIDKLVVSRFAAVAVAVDKTTERGYLSADYGFSKSGTQTLPCRLGPSDHFLLTVSLPPSAKDSKYGELEIVYSVLGSEVDESKNLSFRIR